MKEKKKKRTGVSKATAARVQLRTEDVLRIRLDGAQIWDVREYVREKELEVGSPWHLAPGKTPLTDSQLYRYMAAADRLLAEGHKEGRRKLIRNHLAKRRSLYAKAVLAGDLRTALACVQDEARLLGVYPAAEHKVKTEHESTHVVEFIVTTREQADAAIAALAEASGVPRQ